MADEKKTAKKSISKSDFFEAIAKESGFSKADVKKFYAAFEKIVTKNLAKKGPGVLIIPGIVKLTARKKPATKGGETKPNPFKPGEMMVTKPKPASVKLVARGLKKFLENLK